MLSTNVLCIKKRKKRSYCIAGSRSSSSEYAPTSEKSKRSASGATAMLHITEDTPPDMLAGAMDLTVHLPTGRSVKMSIERSTPMMDLLVQITTNYHLQLSGYTLQALGMAPSSEHSDKILPFKPNTPIGALDTQHIKVVPKPKTIPVPKNIPPGHQPFESTFRLKVHLPRNQLYVTRVSQSVHLEDIMKKVCDEKNLDPIKYEFRHPGNLDETLDPKLSLSDYQITEVYIVSKGTVGLNQAFTSNDIMALRKEEERKQMHNKTGGGVFNLIFRRGNNKASSGSLSSENRSISPTQSDDSRSVTPPAVQQQTIQPEPPTERPKPPQRKRRPAPKPPQIKETPADESHQEPLPQPNAEQKNVDTNGLTICHSRNSSDSSGYHEASILSDNCNTSLPRRPKSTVISEKVAEEYGTISGVYSQSTSNLSKMTPQSKSTSSLAFPNRKKKTAPPPPPVLKSTSSVASLDVDDNKPSPVVASQPPIVTPPSSSVAQSDSHGCGHGDLVNISIAPVAAPRHKNAPPIPAPRPRHSKLLTTSKPEIIKNRDDHDDVNEAVNLEILKKREEEEDHAVLNETLNPELVVQKHEVEIQAQFEDNVRKGEEEIKSSKQKLQELQKIDANLLKNLFSPPTTKELEKIRENPSLEKGGQEASKSTVKPPEVVGFSYKQRKNRYTQSSMFDSCSRKRGFLIGSSLLGDINCDDDEQKKSSLSTTPSVSSALDSFDFVDEIDDLDHELFTGSLSRNSENANLILNQLHGIHDYQRLPKNPSLTSLRSVNSLPGFLSGGSNIKKWNNHEDLDGISLHSTSEQQEEWVVGDTSDTESGYSTIESTSVVANKSSSEKVEIPKEVVEKAPPLVILNGERKVESGDDLESDWHYRLPSPPKAFRDSSPARFDEQVTTCNKSADVTDSVVTSPELFEKLKAIKNTQDTTSDLTSTVSEDDDPILSGLTLEHLEKRKSLVYNRELATSFKEVDDGNMIDDKSKDIETFSGSVTTFEKTYEEMRRSSQAKEINNRNTLPNFKITTYDKPKTKLNIFEDDTIRSNEKTSANDSRRQSDDLERNYVQQSTENLRKNSLGSQEDFRQPTEYKFYRPSNKPPVHITKSKYVSVLRSESLSHKDHNNWTPNKPVMRSKSQVALNKNLEKNGAEPNEDNLAKSNSLFDLQSIGVMRLIQNKLNTPTNSTENLNVVEEPPPPPRYQRPPELKAEVQKVVELDKPTYHYRYTTPSINMGTWSDRPKIPVNVKDDPDYKFGSYKDHSKLIVNTTNNDIKSNNSYEIKSQPKINSFNIKVNSQADYNKNVSIKVNGSESILAQNGGNVVIKIGENPMAVTLRKPLGNLDKNEQRQRPHSIAFDVESDSSRVPFVRSVELKKPYKDIKTSNNNNTSITPIFHHNNNEYGTQTLNRNSYNNEYNGVSKLGGYKSNLSETSSKPNFRVNSFVQNSAPVVRGFRSDSATETNRWSQPHSFATLPNNNTNATKISSVNTNHSFNTKNVTPVPFSQVKLRRTESANPPPPPKAPPIILKPVKYPTSNKHFNTGPDPKEQLLQAIRNFGGKKGFKATKA